jgi:hypothetical protein
MRNAAMSPASRAIAARCGTPQNSFDAILANAAAILEARVFYRRRRHDRATRGERFRHHATG